MLVENYQKALQAIYDHVGLTEDWVVCPIDSKIDMFWSVDTDQVKYAETLSQFESENGDYYVDQIYFNRFYPQHVYRGEQYTLIFCDSGVDGMEWWRIFDNNKEVKDNS